MSSIHIIMLFAAAIILVGVFFIARLHIKKSILGTEKDVIDLFEERKEKEIETLGVSVSMTTYYALLLVIPIALGVIVYVFSQNGIAAIALALIGIIFPDVLIRVMAHNTSKRFEERYAKSLEQLGASLRVGMSISQAVEDVASCKFVHETIRLKYAKISSDLMLGLSVEEAFNNFAKGTGSKDAMDVALAISVQSEVGGKEAEVIQTIANNIHERLMLRKEVSSIFSGTSSMIWMMDIFPIILFAGFTITNEEYAHLYFSEPKYMLLFFGLIAFVALGCFINHRSLHSLQNFE